MNAFKSNLKIWWIAGKYACVHSELVSKNYTKPFSKHRNIRKKDIQYLWKEKIEVNPAPEDIEDKQLQEKTCQALLVTSTAVSPGDLEPRPRMRRKDRVIVRFSRRKKWNNEMSAFWDELFKKKKNQNQF